MVDIKGSTPLLTADTSMSLRVSSRKSRRTTSNNNMSTHHATKLKVKTQLADLLPTDRVSMMEDKLLLRRLLKYTSKEFKEWRKGYLHQMTILIPLRCLSKLFTLDPKTLSLWMLASVVTGQLRGLTSSHLVRTSPFWLDLHQSNSVESLLKATPKTSEYHNLSTVKLTLCRTSLFNPNSLTRVSKSIAT